MQNFDDVTLVAQRFDTYLECFSVVPLFFCQAMIRSSSTQLHCTIFHGTYLVWIGSDAIISTGVGINFILIFLFINVKSSSLSLLLHSIDFPHLFLEACDIWFHCLSIPFFFAKLSHNLTSQNEIQPILKSKVWWPHLRGLSLKVSFFFDLKNNGRSKRNFKNDNKDFRKRPTGLF